MDEMFYIISEDQITRKSKYSEGGILVIKTTEFNSNQKGSTIQLCIYPELLSTVYTYVDEKKMVIQHDVCENMEMYEIEEFEEEMPIVANIFLSLIFIKVEVLISEYSLLTCKVVEQFSTTKLLRDAAKQNLTNNPNQYKQIGVTKKIFDLIPNNHNYFDRNTICTCGITDCGQTHIWYVKYEGSFTIPFLICNRSRIHLNLKHYADNFRTNEYIYNEKTQTWQEILEEDQEPSYGCDTFPYRIEEKDFILVETVVQPNEKRIKII